MHPDMIDDAYASHTPIQYSQASGWSVVPCAASPVFYYIK